MHHIIGLRRRDCTGIRSCLSCGVVFGYTLRRILSESCRSREWPVRSQPEPIWNPSKALRQERHCEGGNTRGGGARFLNPGTGLQALLPVRLLGLLVLRPPRAAKGLTLRELSGTQTLKGFFLLSGE